MNLTQLTALEAVNLLVNEKVSPVEMINAAADHISKTDGVLNAVPTLCIDRALKKAPQIMKKNKQIDNSSGWLGGLPIIVKDLHDVEGVRTTYGSTLYSDHVPENSDIMVETLESNGAIVIGKSNTPEFGHGANTFNEVFGKTRNPWNPAATCGGSSGGSAVALATGQAWLATGSDLGCSLRTPSSFCSTVGLRPSPGRVARGPTRLPYDNLCVQGPMARNVADVALMLDAMTGVHSGDPISIPTPSISFFEALKKPSKLKRVAYSSDLNGLTPIDSEVSEICKHAAEQISALDVVVEEACPDLHDARNIFQVLRANQFVGDLGPIIEKDRSKVKKEVIWNLEEGYKLTAQTLAEAERARGKLFDRIRKFFMKFDLLITPATIVPPFDINNRYLEKVGDHTFPNYYDWYTIAYAITITSLPALSLPCGFTKNGLPVGLQIVAPPRGEASLLREAEKIERLFGIASQLPIKPKPSREL